MSAHSFNYVPKLPKMGECSSPKWGSFQTNIHLELQTKKF